MNADAIISLISEIRSLKTMEETNEMTYTQAVTELEEIVQKMQDPECSIDNLSAYTKRSKELLDICRQKLTAADEQLKQILATIQQQS